MSTNSEALSKMSKRDQVLTVRRREDAFYTAMAVAAIIVAATGFSGTIQREFAGTGKLSLLVHIHAAIAAAWLFLFLAQVRLIASNNFRLHRQLGTLGVLLAIAHVLTGYLTATAAARRGFDLSGGNDPVGFMIFPLGDLLAFTILVTSAFLLRRRPSPHKRLMLLALATTLGAPLTHFIAQTPTLAAIPNVIVPALLVFWFGSAVFDRLALGRIHPVSLWGGIGLFVWGNLRAIVLQPSDAWHAVGRSLIS
jgi:hypothetical protein